MNPLLEASLYLAAICWSLWGVAMDWATPRPASRGQVAGLIVLYGPCVWALSSLRAFDTLRHTILHRFGVSNYRCCSHH